MNLSSLKNNAMFLSCWHERNRPVQLICFAVLIASVLLLSFLSISIQEKVPEKIWTALFYVIAVVQAVVLLLEGSIFVGYLAGRERTSETLDFHRNSPQPVLEKVGGLIFGGTWFEWLVFTIFFIIELPFAFLPKIAMTDILMFNLSLFLTGILFHTTAAAISIISPQKKRASPFVVFMALFFFGWPLFGFLFATSQSSFFSHLFGVTAIAYIYADKAHLPWHGWFFSFEMPLIVVQIMTQLPLFLLLIRGMKRVFTMPNSPAWSKEDVIRFCTFIFVMITGFFVASYIHFDQAYMDPYYYRYPQQNTTDQVLYRGLSTFLFLFIFIGFAVGFFCVPSYFKRSKYVVLKNKLGAKLSSFFDDGATSLPTALIFVVIGGICAVPYFLISKISPQSAWASVLMLSSHVIAFIGFLEYFRLGHFRGNKIFFITTLIVWWIFIPWLAWTIYNFKYETFIDIGAISPFVGTSYAIAMTVDAKIGMTLRPLIGPCLIAILMWFLVMREHAAIKQRVKN